MIKISNEWLDYECIDASDKEKIERWDNIVLRRPDPNAMWRTPKDGIWNNPVAIYHRSDTGGGFWEFKKQLPEQWTIKYKNLTFKVSPTNFKHTGIFPEQAVNWDFIMNKISNANRPIKVLNLFAYTGCATMAAASAGATVFHVDAAKGMVDWAKENAKLCKLEDKEIHFIVDDCLKFVEREIRRGNKYDAIIMDPPSYGRGPNKELWKIEDNLHELITKCLDILSDKPLFFLVNSYTAGFSPLILENILKTTVLKRFPSGNLETGDLGLPITKDNMILPCGIYGVVDYD